MEKEPSEALLNEAFKSLGQIDDLVNSLEDTASKIACTELDLSAMDPYGYDETIKIIEDLGKELKDSEEFSILLDKSNYKELLIIITNTYRNVVLNTLIGIGTKVQNIIKDIDVIGPERDNSAEEIKEIRRLIVEDYIYMPSPEAVGRSIVSEFLCRYIMMVNDHWNMIFTDKEHRALGKNYLLKKIDEKTLREKFTNMNTPNIDNMDFNSIKEGY